MPAAGTPVAYLGIDVGKSSHSGGAVLPLDGIVSVTVRHGHVRAGRNMAGVLVLLGGRDERALQQGPHMRDRRDGRLSVTESGGQEDDRIRPRASEQDQNGIGYHPYSGILDQGRLASDRELHQLSRHYLICCLVTRNHMKGHGPYSVMRSSPYERNYALPSRT